MSVQEKALEKAIQFLNAANVQYRIARDGVVVHDTFPPPADAKEPRKKTHDWVATTDYIEKIKALSPGDTLKWSQSDHKEFDGDGWLSFSASLHGACRRAYGEDNYIIDNKRGTAEILRVA